MWKFRLLRRTRLIRWYLAEVRNNTRLILERMDEMDARLQALKTSLDAYTAKVDAYVTAAEAFKATVDQQVAIAVAADDAEEDVDITAMSDAITTAKDKVPAPPAEPPVVPNV